MSLSCEDVEYLRSVASRVSGNHVPGINDGLLKTKLTPVATKYGFQDVETLIHELRRQPSKYQASVAEAMTINETSFFRDMHPYETLVNDILPGLLKDRAQKKCLTIWCSACSSGQEPFSMAMTLLEHFPQLSTWQVKIVATDISDEMLRRTGEGVYTQLEVNRGLPAKMLNRFFQREGSTWRVNQDLRKWIDCRKLNLVQNWPAFPCFDLVFMRNVLIYFDNPTKEAILRRTVRHLSADGHLFLGGGESLIGLKVPLERIIIGKTTCFRPSIGEGETLTMSLNAN